MVGRTIRGSVAVLLIALWAIQQGRAEPLRILVFSKTAGFRHSSIAAGIQSIGELGAEYGFDVNATEDATQFTDAGLASYDAVVFLSTTGQVLNTAQEDAFERFIQAGNGFVGIHAAADPATTGTHFWPWYVELLGARFRSHPAQQNATIEVVSHDHPSTAHLDTTWQRFDEWYEFRDYSDEVTLLLELDGDSYNNGGGIDGFFPHAWYHEFDGGRSWYTAGGHTADSFSEPDFRRHLAGGILWAASDPGDYNRDGAVDAADYVAWRKSLGQTGLGLAADGNFNSEVDAADYDVWRAHFGTVGADGASTLSIINAAAPEPGSEAMLMAALLATAVLRPLRGAALQRKSGGV